MRRHGTPRTEAYVLAHLEGREAVWLGTFAIDYLYQEIEALKAEADDLEAAAET